MTPPLGALDAVREEKIRQETRTNRMILSIPCILCIPSKNEEIVPTVLGPSQKYVIQPMKRTTKKAIGACSAEKRR